MDFNLGKEFERIYISKKEIETYSLKLNLTKYLPKYMIPEELHRINSFILNNNNKIDRNHYMNKK